MDCGIHPGLRNKESLPFIDAIPDIQTTDLVLVSHFHLDHSGGLPHLLLKTGTKSKCYMTHATKAIYRYLLADFVRVSNSPGLPDQSLYTDRDILASLERIDTLDFHQELEVNGIKFTAYHAGHVLGAAMFLIEIAGVKILYTGDFSRQEDRHLMCAEVPPVRPDVLITESTYGIHIHDKREEREARFTRLVHDIVGRGGRCLIPAFALGRAQELMLILDEYWAAHPELHDVPIYYASQLARKCMAVYQTYIHAMNERIRNQLANNNPFCFRHISNLKSIEHFDDSGPCVVMASPGMMQSGLSRELFENWCTDKRNGVIIAGYCVEGTPAKQILSLPAEIPTMSGQTLPLKCSVDYISFSAHTDYQQTSAFIRELKPSYVILVHGEQNEMLRLAGALQPYTELATTTVSQLISIPFTGSANLLKFHLTLLAGTVKLLAEEQNMVQFRVFGAVTVTWRPQQVHLEWQSNPTNDMYADAVQNVVLRAAMQGLPPRGLPQLVEPDQRQIRMALEVTLQDAFGTNCLKMEQIDPKATSVQVLVDSHVAEIDLDNLTVRCETNPKLEHIIRVMVHRLNHCISAV
ncbi:Cleavage and polyadenylation specificity factor subunit 3 [Fasciolopsis buskii]|uniref:Cleavage and polyadenylation specificity factor subunit 3 n=1 Tax=Fasciolopsis buskii TaxID=27845 RepID=A0A8E0VI59_9TREM|nr:Cleavage and polyadenylation specificity factor subunit 3 [Fasciolopsis buski]